MGKFVKVRKCGFWTKKKRCFLNESLFCHKVRKHLIISLLQRFNSYRDKTISIKKYVVWVRILNTHILYTYTLNRMIKNRTIKKPFFDCLKKRYGTPIRVNYDKDFFLF
jgi:hypothetical protein